MFCERIMGRLNQGWGVRKSHGKKSGNKRVEIIARE